MNSNQSTLGINVRLLNPVRRTTPSTVETWAPSVETTKKAFHESNATHGILTHPVPAERLMDFRARTYLKFGLISGVVVGVVTGHVSREVVGRNGLMGAVFEAPHGRCNQGGSQIVGASRHHHIIAQGRHHSRH